MAMTFPHEKIRPSQKEFMEDVKHSIENKRHLIADVPTGIGKTIASLFPAMNYALSNNKTIFFLTSRLSHHRMAVETLKMMKKENNFSAMDIIGKKHLCSFDVKDMDSALFSSFCSSMIKEKRCQYFRNTFLENRDDEKERLLGLMRQKSPAGSQEYYAMVSYDFCTYEMLLEAAKNSDAIICDYFHIFGINDKFLIKTGKKLSDCILIIDEAHNLSARLRNNLSARMTARTCEMAVKEARDFSDDESEEIAKDIGRALQKAAESRLFGKAEAFAKKEDLTERINDYDEKIAVLKDSAEKVFDEKKVSYMDRLAKFLESWKGDDYGYARILSRARILGRDYISMEYSCLDPSLISKQIINGSHSVILMSGTLSPTEMHRDILGIERERTTMKSYSSPFPKQNRKNIIISNVTTKYSSRTENSFRHMADMVKVCAEKISGNAAVFFPSYEIRDKIHGLISPIKKHVILEDPKMTKEERDEIKDVLEKNQETGAVLLGVVGGSFSEGVDLPGRLLNGVVIVGLPLERPSLSVQSLIDYYEQRFGRGREYGYNYPAMIKVMQAAGRCIRNENDRGVVVFADERFLWQNYRKIFPKSWDFVVTDRPEKEIEEFFN